jgi:tetratricopeptide (TPR) repeat protein
MPSIEQLEKLLLVDPDDPFVRYGLAQEYAKQGRADLAIQHYDRCLAADPAYLYAYYHKARAQSSAGDRAGALATLDAGLVAARAARDAHAAAEIEALREELA